MTPLPQSFANSDLTCNNIYPPSAGVDGTTLSFWVNGSALELVNDAITSTPDYPFPNLRLSTAVPLNSTQLFLYNQFNGSFISEHMFDITTGAWTSSNITIQIE